MNEIIQRLMDRTGLPEEQAHAAVDTVIAFLREKLPEPMASQIEGFLDGSTGLGNSIGSLGGDLGGMFGRRE